MQVIHTKDYGDIQVQMSWVAENMHIVKLANGGYAHVTGLPVQSLSEITKCIPAGPEREEAIYWFEHRHEQPEKPVRRLIINPDGSVMFDDGRPVENMSDLVENLQPGPFLDAALQWFMQKQAAAQKVNDAVQTVAGQIAQEMVEKESKPKPVVEKPKPKPFGQSASQKK